MLINQALFAGTLEIDWMESYSTNALAQSGYVTNGTETDAAAFLTASDNATALYAPNSYAAQTFTLSSAGLITGIKVELGNSGGSPTGNWVFRIENVTDSKPNGTLAHANLSKSQAVTASAWNTVYFDSPAVLATGTYAIYPDVSGTTSDGSNFWRFRRVLAGGYTGGNACSSSDGSTWATETWDFVFEVLTIPLQSYSEATIKTQGSYAIKGAADTSALNKTLTKTFSTNHNLTGVKNLWFDARASRTGSNIKLGLHDTGGTTTEITPSIITADTFQKVKWDWSAVSDANKDNIDTLTITVTNADAANTFYLDYAEIAQAIDLFGWTN